MMYFKHGLSGNRLWQIWKQMIARCERPTTEKDRRNYCGRGIRVCEAWMTFSVFREWADSNGYANHLTIERIDNSKGYDASNCTWIPQGQQNANRRMTRWLTYKGETLPITVWALRLGLTRSGIHARLKAGWPLERALSANRIGYPRAQRLALMMREG